MEWPAEDGEQRLARLRFLVRVLDTAITLPNGFRFGADSLIELLPGFGDTMTTLIAAYFVYEGYRFGLPRRALISMILRSQAPPKGR
jgi:Domain of unknown function (DUF4112)